jgi:sulfatase maturation enzyme AslB (radical SAM superfamily)
MNPKIDKFKLSEYDYNKHLAIELVVTDICNQKCDYCHWNFSRIPLPKRVMTLNEFDKVCEFIDKQERDTIEINLYGGEPTLNPHLPEIVDRLYSNYADRLVKVNLLTNLTKKSEYFDQFMKYPIGITASYHPDDVISDTQFFFNLRRILPNLELFCVVFNENNYKKAIRVYNMLKNELGESIRLHKIDQFSLDDAKKLIGSELDDMIVYDYAETPDETEEGVEVIADDNYLCHKDYENIDNFRGMICSASYIILSDGNILKCWNDMGIRVLTNIYTENIVKLPVWEICRHTSCFCGKRFTKLSPREYINEIKNRNN